MRLLLVEDDSMIGAAAQPGLLVGKAGKSAALLIQRNDRQLVFDGRSAGPCFLAPVGKGRYSVTPRCDAWSFRKPVTVDKQRKRVVLEVVE